ncbi:MAG: YgcG family protein [Rhizobiales bacterium]|nr:YgcG family protein [Hyphomicrobiales bacterium]MBN8985742.1 YgcG family protein [Hyphomicrobiales bacterium]
MKTVAAALLAWMLCWAVVAVADVAVPPLTGRVVDQTGTLTSEQVAALDGTLQAFEQRKGSQIAVLIVPTTEPETIEQFSIRVAEAWKIGRKKIDDGAILVVAKDDRRLRIEVGYGLEGALTDVTSKRIIDEIITPKFRQGDFAGGISAGVDRIIGVIDGEPLPEPKRRQQSTNIFDNLESIGPVAFFAVLVFGGIFRSIFGRLLGAAVTGGLVGLVIWFLAGTLAVAAIIGAIAFVFTLVGDSVVSSGGGRGGWSGGSGGGWSGGSSGGGFSGGGGSFGGGGASGRW